ncbi:MAG: L-seryl-tRNA(Sec) selenium transferase, partial [Acidobacteria bacterium]|nr:L-seryl-tRNA(Sec) selenium transferase [Acidobacteriota bacterium]
MTVDNPYRDLPSVDQLAAELEGRLPWPLVVDAVRTALHQSRRDIEEGKQVDARRMAENLVKTLERSDGTKVINATGVLLHTNLGRAVWSTQAIKQAGEVAANYTNVEIDIDTGRRARRGSYVSTLLKTLTGAEDALIVNNNAAAVVLCVNEFASGRDVLVSRGELIEIGGSFRIPEMIERAGARLVEVGTTNRTRIDDYRQAIGNSTGLILKVHPANYRIEGFVSSAGLDDLVKLGSEQDVPVAWDLGSAAPVAVLQERLQGPLPAVGTAAGVDLVMWSGDKLLGGPQAGIIHGQSGAVDRLRSNPLLRTYRVDKLTLASLEATLQAWRDPETAKARIPIVRMLA